MLKTGIWAAASQILVDAGLKRLPESLIDAE